jgi:Type II secretion system (T2SS), protein G
MIEEAPVRRDPIVIALAVLASVTGIICLTLAVAQNPLILGPYAVFRLIAAYGLLRMKAYGLILELVSALLWVVIPTLVVLYGLFDFFPPGPIFAFLVVSGTLSFLELVYLCRAQLTALFAKRGQPGAPLPLVAKAGWFGGQLALLLSLHLAVPPLPTIRLFGSAQDRSHQHRTMEDMKTIALALESRAMDFNDYPFAASIEALAPKLSPTYLKQVTLRDSWGHPWRYSAWKVNPKTPGRDYYVIISAGRDGRFEVIDPKLMEAFVRANKVGQLSTFSPKETTNSDCDIVYSNGTFIQYPERVSPPVNPW